MTESSSPARRQGSQGALCDLLDAYADQPADDAPGKPSTALVEYLGVLRLVDPTGPCVAAAQLRRFLDADLTAMSAAATLPWPQVADRWAWMATVAELIESAVDGGTVPYADVPATAWGWRRRFPQLFQLLGGYFGQDFLLEYPDLPPAVAAARLLADWRRATPPAVRARTLGELYELLTLGLDRADLEFALDALGRDVELAPDPTLWLGELLAALAAGT